MALPATSKTLEIQQTKCDNDEDDTVVASKLEKVKEIKIKMDELHRLQNMLMQEWETTEREDKCLHEYQSEMDQLLQEKMSHVEELRLIHADINMMENTMKQSQKSRDRCLDNVRRLHADYIPLKEEIDKMRDSIGLDKLPGLPDEEKLKKDYLNNNRTRPTWLHSPPDFLPPTVTSQIMVATRAANQMVSKPLTPLDSRPFRQQPPPMKSCLSCHQQIHRNAPICPLCKAKSRSRHPKKNKRKHEETN
ncbi:zinc finger C4H2 domain-containing protein-like [Xenia sp. Carnegie-2017]|uniref:zinc finger C4H2 domain-containing protein-like n=1 Tax=Xenia sp. Carnegie-2017 TaxID=2897299 RepID=UPI001F0424A3|nr:zinc finger C4H2 domain-containing protein-like [Xenia sp. Carnegie-2017]XP_046848308.1 zinc finger C4H2 domain-containing protein-like [Xenia sp. Carnegie-2017]